MLLEVGKSTAAQDEGSTRVQSLRRESLAILEAEHTGRNEMTNISSRVSQVVGWSGVKCVLISSSDLRIHRYVTYSITWAFP